VPVRCFYFTADEALARHNDAYRALTKKTTTSPLPDVAFHMFNAKFTVPDAEAEDFDEIKHVPFVPEFEDDATRKAWLRWHV
jgi:bifunctional polynucleotide phosphatase/kinase